jgi:putative peptidoglycan lipid II flippase
VLKSTVGTWVNYATTALFQVLFASRFGAGTDASSYALTFAIAVGVGATFVGTAQVMYLPRLLTQGDAVSLIVVRKMLRLTLIALAVFVVLAASAPLITPVLAPRLDLPGVHFALLIRTACGFGFLQVVVGQLAVLCWARGARFIPAMSPAIPSIITSIALVITGAVSPSMLYLLLIAGSVIQLLVLTLTGGRDLGFSREPPEQRGEPPILVSLGLFATAQIIGPFQLLIAAHGSRSGGADFNYAYRAIVVAQALIVGGVAAASLPEWSSYVRAQARRELARSIERTISTAALALSLAAAVGLVASTALVRVVFERGNFNAHDTRVVSAIIVAALGGFVAEGVMLVLAQALAADRRIRMMIAFGQGRAGVLILLVAILGLTGGPIGVAAGYSAANVIALGLQLLYLRKDGMLPGQESRLVQSTVLITTCTGAAGAVLLAMHVPPVPAVVLVMAVFASVTIGVRGSLPDLRGPL